MNKGSPEREPKGPKVVKDREKPFFEIFRTKYQKGDRASQETGNRQAHYRSRYINKERADKAIDPLLLKETAKWVPERRVKAARIFTTIQARKVLNALREVEGPEASEHLPNDVAESEFETAKPAHLDIVPVGGKIMLVGLMFPLMDEIKDLGFVYERDIEEANSADNYTIAVADFNYQNLTALLDEWGDFVRARDALSLRRW